jgi:hypothetical protein
MPLQTINEQIQQAASQNRLPMLCYALNEELMPNACYQELTALQENGNLPQNLPWVLGLYWVRRFYNEGKGNNYLDVIGETSFHQSPRAKNVFTAWGMSGRFSHVGNAANLYAFLSECWIIAGENTTSNLRKALQAIVDKAPESFDADDVIEVIGRIRDEGAHIPVYLAWRAENGRWLAESIRAIKAGGGDGWLGVIGNNPSWRNYRQRDNATCAWGLRKDGNRVQWAIRIANVRLQENSSIKFQQFNRTLFECQGERHVLLSELGPAYDTAKEIIMRAGNRKLDLGPLPELNQNRPLLFRKSRTSSFHRLINWEDNHQEEGSEHIQASRLFLLSPTGQNGNANISLGGQPVHPAYAGQFTPDMYGASLHELNLDHCDRTKPQWLSWNGTNLLQIGGKPYIKADNVAGDIILRDRPEVLVVFGTKCGLHAANLPQDHAEPEWSIEGGRLLGAQEGVVVTSNAPGRMAKATCKIGNTRCQTRLIFLPEALQAAVTGMGVVEGDGWAWVPETDEYKNCAAAENGRVRGRARVGDLQWEIEAASSRPLWWWRSGIGGAGTYFCAERVDVITLSDLQNKRLLVHIPVGAEARLYLNGQALGVDPLPEGLNNVPIFELLRGALDFNALGQVSTLSLQCGGNNHVLTRLLAYPATPVLIHTANGPAAFFPKAAQAADYQVVIIRESALLSDNIQRISLAPGNVVGSLHPLDFGNLGENEGCWVLLLPNAPGNQGAMTLAGLAWELRNDTAGQGTVLQIQSPCLVSPVPLLLQQWNGGQPLTGQQVEAIKRIAAFIRGGNSPTLKTIFERFLRHEKFSCLAGNAPAATSFFEKHMEGRFAVADLCEPLSQLLHMGFNWLAEPNWISGKESRIRTQYGNPGDNRRRNWRAQQGEQALIEQLPIFPAITDIEVGYPYQVNVSRVPQLREIATLDFNGQNGPLHGVIRISFIGAEKNLHGVYRDGFRGHGSFRYPAQNNPNQSLNFSYHGRRLLRGVWDANAANFVNAAYTSQVVDDNAAIGHFVRQDPMEGLQESIVGDGISRPNLDVMFTNAIASASHTIDGNGICGLCHLFRISWEAFRVMADAQPGQVNRDLIFQVAVLNALNRWLGWNGAAYPDGWPLSERVNADLLCGLTARIWDEPVARKTLMQDQIPVEWLLAWFHNSPNA